MLRILLKRRAQSNRKIEDTSSQEDIKTVTYEVTNTRDVPIKNLILKQK